ncbi:MAG: hypothetical protein ABS44_10795 [Chryseobacterium sp. SCN 40-13]|nr:MAG: hypothetical protein ABS44_10795 [Chryseobacterium sp. SCN 40-13]
MKKIPIFLILVSALILTASCNSIPEKAEPVTNFQKDRYLGTWYEIARFDFKHERNMNNTIAQYSLNDDGSIRVLNSGYNYKEQKWKQAEGKAKFRGDETVAALKVSFFGPFYSGYNVIALDENYQYALVAGKDLDYLWILSRTPALPENIKNDYVKKAQEVGYDTSRFVWVEHDKKNPNLK